MMGCYLSLTNSNQKKCRSSIKAIVGDEVSLHAEQNILYSVNQFQPLLVKEIEKGRLL